MHYTQHLYGVDMTDTENQFDPPIVLSETQHKSGPLHELISNSTVQILEDHYRDYGCQVTQINNIPVKDLDKETLLGIILVLNTKDEFTLTER